MNFCPQMNTEDAFFVYVLEAFKASKNISGAQALAELKRTGADTFIRNHFGALHTMSTESILADIGEYIAAQCPGT